MDTTYYLPPNDFFSDEELIEETGITPEESEDNLREEMELDER